MIIVNKNETVKSYFIDTFLNRHAIIVVNENNGLYRARTGTTESHVYKTYNGAKKWLLKREFAITENSAMIKNIENNMCYIRG